MTTREVQKHIGKFLILRKHPVVAENFFSTFNNFEMDVVSISNSNMVHEFEVKISKSDFLHESKKKKKFQLIESRTEKNIPNYFSYVCPEDLIPLIEIKKEFGVYYVRPDGEVIEKRKPTQLHKKVHNITTIKDKLLRTYSQRSFLDGVVLMTHLNDQKVRKVKKILAESKRKRKRNL